MQSASTPSSTASLAGISPRPRSFFTPPTYHQASRYPGLYSGYPLFPAEPSAQSCQKRQVDGASRFTCQNPLSHLPPKWSRRKDYQRRVVVDLLSLPGRMPTPNPRICGRPLLYRGQIFIPPAGLGPRDCGEGVRTPSARDAIISPDRHAFRLIAQVNPHGWARRRSKMQKGKRTSALLLQGAVPVGTAALASMQTPSGLDRATKRKMRRVAHHTTASRQSRDVGPGAEISPQVPFPSEKGA
jgi:hypothetical protein